MLRFLNPSLLTAGGGAASLTAHSGSGVLTTSQLQGQVHTNSGAGASAVTLTLPPASSGLNAHFVQVDSGDLLVNPDDADHIRYSGGQMAAGEALQLQNPVSVLRLVSDGNNRWLALVESGVLVEETP